jgi:hypothetical protein
MTEYTCNGQVGYGLSEYLDQNVDGLPTGTDFRAPAGASPSTPPAASLRTGVDPAASGPAQDEALP